jgi:Domain of unknown function (DUF4190)
LKPCPYCLGEIENAALQCPHCQRWLDPALDSTLNADASPIVLPPRRTSGLAIGSLMCAIFGWGPGSIAAVILGHVALREIRRDPLRIKGKRMATTGIVLGWLGIVALTVILGLGIYFRKMFEEQPQRPQTREVNLTTAGLDRQWEISRPRAPIGG